jgi:UMF1 family MFS transporter
VLVGAVQGGTQALSRSLFGTLIPKDKSGEFFGFFGVAEKFAGILGPAIFAVVSGRSAILALIVFFIVGGALLYFVDVAEGQHKARANEAAGFPA